MPLTGYWTQQLKKLYAFAIPLDSTTHLSVIRDWPINDSISVIILQYSTNVGGDVRSCGSNYSSFLYLSKPELK